MSNESELNKPIENSFCNGEFKLTEDDKRFFRIARKLIPSNDSSEKTSNEDDLEIKVSIMLIKEIIGVCEECRDLLNNFHFIIPSYTLRKKLDLLIKSINRLINKKKKTI